MSPEQFTAILVALGGLLTAAGVLLRAVRGLRLQLRETHELVNGKMSELLTVAQLAALKEGELKGRDLIQNPIDADRRLG